MLKGNNSNCCDRGCEREPSCSIPSSGIYYDGENIPEAGVRHGMPLNTVIANLGRYVARSVSLSGSVKKESFDGPSHVRLGSDPEEILFVTYCGAVLPSEAYKASGRNIVFCEDICMDDEFASVQVVYREKANSSYSFNC